MQGNGQKDFDSKDKDIPQALIKRLADDWDANVFKMLRPPDYPKINVLQCAGIYLWKSLIEEDVKRILKYVRSGENHDQKTK